MISVYIIYGVWYDTVLLMVWVARLLGRLVEMTKNKLGAKELRRWNSCCVERDVSL